MCNSIYVPTIGFPGEMQLMWAYYKVSKRRQTTGGVTPVCGLSRLRRFSPDSNITK